MVTVKRHPQQDVPGGASASAPQSGVSSAYQQIREAILSGDFGPGTPLSEAMLADFCRVSRTPVREALKRLEQDGLAHAKGRGLVVRERSAEEIMDLYDVRIDLETAAARMAAERRTEFDLVRLKNSYAASERVEAGDGDALAESNRDFHAHIWRASHNEALMDLLDRVNMHLLRYPATTLTYPGRWKQALREHAGLIVCLESRDAANAAELARTHFTAARDIRLALWAE